MMNDQSWGISLWDQTSNLLKYQESGIALHERIQKFLIDIGKMQTEAFAAQKKLCEKYRLNIKKAIGLETTFGIGFNEFVQAVGKLIDSETLMPLSFDLQATGETKKAIEEQRQQLKKWRQSRDRFQTEIKTQIKIIEEEKRRYREKYNEVLRCKAEFEKVDADNTCSRLEVEKALNLYSLKNCEFKRARADYLVALDQFNMNRGHHYNHTLKQWGEVGQQMELFRIKKTQELLCVLAERLRVTIERMSSVCSDLEATAARIDAKQDSRAIIERLRTGNLPPQDEPFEDLVIDDPPVVNLESYGESMRKQMSINSLPTAVVNTDDPEAAVNGNSPLDTVLPATDVSSSRNKYGTRGRRMSSSSTAPMSGPAARRLSTSSVAAGQLNANGQSIMRKLFSRRSKRADSMDANCLPSSCNISRRNSLLFEYVKPWRRSHRSHSIHWRSRSFMCQDNEVYASPTSVKEPLSVGGAPTRDRSRKSACLSSSIEDVTFGRPSSIQESPLSHNEQIELTPAELPKPEEKKYLFDNSDMSDGTFDSTENLIDVVQDTDQQNAAPPQIAVTPQSPVAAPSEQDLSLTRHSQPLPVSNTTTTLQDDVVVGPGTFSNDLEPQGLTARTSRSLEQPVQEKQEVGSAGFPKPARPPPPSQLATLSTNSGTYQRVPCTDNRISEQERFGRGHVSGTNGALTVKPRTSTVYSGPVPCLRSNKNGFEGSPRRQPKADGSPVHQRTGTPQQPARHGVHQPKRHPADRTGTPHSNSPQDLHSEGTAKEMVVVGTCTALYDFTSEQFGTSFLSFAQGDEFDVLASREQFPDSLAVEGWYYAERTKPAHGNPRFGFVPATFVQFNVFTEVRPLSRTSAELYHAQLAGTSPSHSDRSKQYDTLGSRHHRNYHQNVALGEATEL